MLAGKVGVFQCVIEPMLDLKHKQQVGSGSHCKVSLWLTDTFHHANKDILYTIAMPQLQG